MEKASALAKLKNCGDILELPLGDWNSRTLEGKIQKNIEDTLSNSNIQIVNQQSMDYIKHSVTKSLSTYYIPTEFSVNIQRSNDNPNSIIVETEIFSGRLAQHNKHVWNFKAIV